jgi:hypothetical protein
VERVPVDSARSAAGRDIAGSRQTCLLGLRLLADLVVLPTGPGMGESAACRGCGGHLCTTGTSSRRRIVERRPAPALRTTCTTTGS